MTRESRQKSSRDAELKWPLNQEGCSKYLGHSSIFCAHKHPNTSFYSTHCLIIHCESYKFVQVELKFFFYPIFLPGHPPFSRPSPAGPSATHSHAHTLELLCPEIYTTLQLPALLPLHLSLTLQSLPKTMNCLLPA